MTKKSDGRATITTTWKWEGESKPESDASRRAARRMFFMRKCGNTAELADWVSRVDPKVAADRIWYLDNQTVILNNAMEHLAAVLEGMRAERDGLEEAVAAEKRGHASTAATLRRVARELQSLKVKKRGRK